MLFPSGRSRVGGIPRHDLGHSQNKYLEGPLTQASSLYLRKKISARRIPLLDALEPTKKPHEYFMFLE